MSLRQALREPSQALRVMAALWAPAAWGVIARRFTAERSAHDLVDGFAVLQASVFILSPSR
jgi:hypothetical protein